MRPVPQSQDFPVPDPPKKKGSKWWWVKLGGCGKRNRGHGLSATLFFKWTTFIESGRFECKGKAVPIQGLVRICRVLGINVCRGRVCKYLFY